MQRRTLIFSMAVSGLSLCTGCALKAARKEKMIRAMPEPDEMPDYMSVFQYMGNVTINGKPATIESRITYGDIIETSDGSEVTFVLDKDAWMLGAGTRIRLPKKMMGGTYELEQGGALGVFASRQIFVSTPDAIIGIRGTGVYTQVEATRTYVCTCYGATEITARADTRVRESIVSKRHDAPRYITRQPGADYISPAPFSGHEDKSLEMIETLVGRQMP